MKAAEVGFTIVALGRSPALGFSHMWRDVIVSSPPRPGGALSLSEIVSQTLVRLGL